MIHLEMFSGLTYPIYMRRIVPVLGITAKVIHAPYVVFDTSYYMFTHAQISLDLHSGYRGHKGREHNILTTFTDNFTLHVAIRSSTSLINLSASTTFLCRGEMSFQIGISQVGIGETLRSSASRKTV